jgi:hypothetical protein
MKRVGVLVGLVGAIFCAVHLVAQGEDDALPTGVYRLKLGTLEDMSERNVSRQGDQALNIKGITWQHSESDHFIFHTEVGFAVTQLVGVAEWSYATIKKDLDITQDSFERKCHVYVFLNESAWQHFVGEGKMEPWTGGWCTGRELFFFSRPNFKFQGTTLPHEMTHLVIHRFVGGDVPLWLNEGLAEFEGFRLYRSYLKTRNYSLQNVHDHLDRDQYIPLDTLTSAVDYPRSTEEVTAFYTESQQLVSFLYYFHGGTAPLMNFLKLQSEGARYDSAWHDVYGTKSSDPQMFEKKFIAYVTKSKE